MDGKYFKLTADLDLAGLAYTGAGPESYLEWTPALQLDYGDSGPEFHLDGAGHTIKNMTIRSSSFYNGSTVTGEAWGCSDF